MRTRMVHADFWKSESVAELDMMGRLLFVAMWGMADREGLLLYRPRRIAVEAFPYDGVKPDKVRSIIDQMKSLGMVRELASGDDERTCLQIINFAEYQSVHAKEAQSKLKDRYIPGNSDELRVIPGNSSEFPPASTSTSTSTSTVQSRNLRDEASLVLDHLNKTTGRQFTNLDNIQKCLKREDATVEDCRLVIDHKWAEWGGTDLAKNVNPTTPFRPSHFRAYLDEAKAGPVRAGSAPTAPPQVDRTLVNELDYQVADRGVAAAAAWIDAQPEPVRDALRRRLDKIAEEGAA